MKLHRTFTFDVSDKWIPIDTTVLDSIVDALLEDEMEAMGLTT